MTSTSVLVTCAAGCTAIAANFGGANEIILDNSPGFLIKPGDRRR